MKILEFIASVVTLFGLYLISEGNSMGFTISIFANLAWLYWGHENEANSLMGLNAVMIFINLNGLNVI